MYQWDFKTVLPFMLPLLKGLLWTIWISASAIVLGTLAGVLLAIARKTHLRVIRSLAVAFIEVFLALPVLVLLVWTYYCLPLLCGLRFSPVTTAILVFSLSLAAFVAETMRSGIDAIPEGQIEAGASLQLSRLQIYRYIVLPQAARLMLPALLTQYLSCLKLSTLASVIAASELLHVADNVVSTIYRPLEVYTVVAIMFLCIVLPINTLTRKVEKMWGGATWLP